MPNILPARPIQLLTTHIAKTYNFIVQQQQEPVQQSATADEKGYFIAYENQLINGFVIKKALGYGSFGRVVMVESPEHGILALKICRCTYYFIDAMAQEIEVLRLVDSRCPEISVKLYDTFNIKEHLAVLMEYKEITLYQKLKNTNGRGFPLAEIKHFCRQFAYWLVKLYELQVVHTDMKPENMVMNLNENEVKLIDFGSAVMLEQQNRPSYIQSRFYRAPEITFSLPYDNKLDCWSIGALLVELYTTYVVFPARSSFYLCKMFISLLGLPDERLILQTDQFNVVSVRPKVKKYFQLNNNPEAYIKRETLFKQFKIPPDAKFIPSDDVMYAEDRTYCHPRDLMEILHTGIKEGDSETDLTNFFEVVSNLLVYDSEKRWCGQDILNSRFCAQ